MADKNKLQWELRSVVTGKTEVNTLAAEWAKRFADGDDGIDARDLQAAYAAELATLHGKSRERLRAAKLTIADEQKKLLETAGVVIESGTWLADINAVLPYGYAILPKDGKTILLPASGRMNVQIRETGGSRVLFINGAPVEDAEVFWGSAKRYGTAQKRDSSNTFYRGAKAGDAPVPAPASQAAPVAPPPVTIPPIPVSPAMPPVPVVGAPSVGASKTPAPTVPDRMPAPMPPLSPAASLALLRPISAALRTVREKPTAEALAEVRVRLAGINENWSRLSPVDTKAVLDDFRRSFITTEAIDRFNVSEGTFAYAPSSRDAFEVGEETEFYPYVAVRPQDSVTAPGNFSLTDPKSGQATLSDIGKGTDVRVLPGDVLSSSYNRAAFADDVLLRRKGAVTRVSSLERGYFAIPAADRGEYVRRRAFSRLSYEDKGRFAVDANGLVTPRRDQLLEELSTGTRTELTDAIFSLFDPANLFSFTLDSYANSGKAEIRAKFFLKDGRTVERVFVRKLSDAAPVPPAPAVLPSGTKGWGVPPAPAPQGDAPASTPAPLPPSDDGGAKGAKGFVPPAAPQAPQGSASPVPPAARPVPKLAYDPDVKSKREENAREILSHLDEKTRGMFAIHTESGALVPKADMWLYYNGDKFVPFENQASADVSALATSPGVTGVRLQQEKGDYVMSFAYPVVGLTLPPLRLRPKKK